MNEFALRYVQTHLLRNRAPFASFKSGEIFRSTSVPTFRAFILGASGGVLASEDFDAQSDAQATVTAAALATACSDVCDGFEVWRGSRRVGAQKPLNGFNVRIEARLNEATRNVVANLKERLYQRHESMAKSAKLAAAVEAMKSNQKLQATAVSGTEEPTESPLPVHAPSRSIGRR